MRIFLRDNIDKFDTAKDHNYFFTKDHQLREDISIKLIGEKSLIKKQNSLKKS